MDVSAVAPKDTGLQRLPIATYLPEYNTYGPILMGGCVRLRSGQYLRTKELPYSVTAKTFSAWCVRSGCRVL